VWRWLLAVDLRSKAQRYFRAIGYMADGVPGAQQEFWRPPSVLEPAPEGGIPSSTTKQLAETCRSCHSEFMIGARFCHTCGLRRPMTAAVPAGHENVVDNTWHRSAEWVRDAFERLGDELEKVPFPSWLRYLHFHEIKRWVGLPTAALTAFIIGLGCVAGAVGVSVFYKASNLGEFQAIQLWRIEWLLAATASFVAGILLKKPSE
jgi:hypothetical protein